MNSTKLLLSLAVLCSFGWANAQEVKSGEDVLRAMHDRYAKSWYETLTFNQKSTTYNSDGTTKVEMWHEAVQVPAKLRIDIGDPAKNNGYLMQDGKITIVQDGKEVKTRPLINMLLVLGFDVYRQAPETTAAVIKGEGYDLTKVHEDTWQGQAIYVVGADRGDTKSKQFWVEKRRLLFLRLFEPAQTEPDRIQDIRFVDYREMAGGWVAAGVEVYMEDKKIFTEEYSEIQPNAKLDPATFDPKQFTATHWEKP